MGGFISEYKSTYFFVDYPKRQPYAADKNEKFYSGFLALRIKCVKDIHIGSGYRDFEKTNVLVQQVIRMNGVPVIPGSSLKGVVRGIASAISASCNPERKCLNPKTDKFGNFQTDHCIVCDIFGMMGLASKIVFSDFIPEKEIKTTVKTMNVQFPPNKTGGEKGNKGYMFYQTVDNQYNGAQTTEAELVPAGSCFTGKVFFNKLTEEELCLLCYSLSLNNRQGEGINLKIGGFRNEGIGEIKCETIAFEVNNGLAKKPEALAGAYQKCKTAVISNMRDIEDFMRDGDD